MARGGRLFMRTPLAVVEDHEFEVAEEEIDDEEIGGISADGWGNGKAGAAIIGVVPEGILRPGLPDVEAGAGLEVIDEGVADGIEGAVFAPEVIAVVAGAIGWQAFGRQGGPGDFVGDDIEDGFEDGAVGGVRTATSFARTPEGGLRRMDHRKVVGDERGHKAPLRIGEGNDFHGTFSDGIKKWRWWKNGPFFIVCGEIEGGKRTFVPELKNEISGTPKFSKLKIGKFGTFEAELKNGGKIFSFLGSR
jgi:hypothetical protein